ncbi:Lipid_binding protein [Hexamita inflata]|uniref:Lipid binding protein n=1 Tax=Hexamita inflata TaxID=28002 RepID=A0AA86V768_9EUKA|nr:Lipid binding protein [Hexamita inflata]
MQKIQSIPQAVWDKILPLADQCIQEVMKTQGSSKFEEPKTFKQFVQTSYGVVEGSSFKCIRGEIKIKGDIMKALAYDMEEREVTPDMKKDERAGRACKYIYYPDTKSSDYCKALLKGPQPFQEVVMLLHQVNEAGVPLVSNREFVALRIAKDQSTDKKKFIVYTKSVEPGIDFAKKVVRAQIINFNLYEEVAEGEFKASNFFFCDPCGSIPGAVFNSTLEGQMDYLINLKQYCEK